MQRAQLIAFDAEDRLLEVLQELASSRSIWLRPVRHAKACLSLLRENGANVLVVGLGKDAERPLSLMEQVAHLFPHTSIIAVGLNNNPPLDALAWDLGAAYVLSPPQPLERIREIVLGFLG